MNEEIIKRNVEKIKARRGFKKAYSNLLISREINTGNMKYFNISLDSFLRYAQRSKEQQEIIIDQLINLFK